MAAPKITPSQSVAIRNITSRITVRLVILIALALLAFAGNSLLTRAALGDPANSASGFAAIRLLSGAVILLVIGLVRRLDIRPAKRDIPAILALSIYAAGFSFAYISMAAASGALILFTAVQGTMIIGGLMRGARLNVVQAAGFALALIGLIWLLLPGLDRPPVIPAMLMITAGVAWGIYSILGQSAREPVGRTARNFIGTLPVAAALLICLPAGLTLHGWALAIAAGAITSALGYALWYAALPALSAFSAGVLQLSVPIITALGGALLLNEPVGWRLIGAGSVILAGIALTLRPTNRE